MKKEALVKNASSRKQVRDAGKKEKIQRSAELNDLDAVLRTVAGQKVMYRILEQCSTFQTPPNLSEEVVYFMTGKQDIGHWLMAEIGRANPDALVNILKSKYTKNEGE